MTSSDCQIELERAKADALETAETLENLVEGIRAVKRILDRPIDLESEDKANGLGEASDITQVSMLSNKLVGVLGSELIGLLNASVMVKGHAKLRVEDDKKVIEELHSSREVARKLGEQAERAESMNLRLKAEKKLLIREVRSLREARQVLVKEVKATRKLVAETKQFDSWRLLQNHLRDATMVHESVLNNKTFNNGFGGIDPPGAEVATDTNMEERVNEDEDAGDLLVADKENNGELVYSPRREEDEDENAGRVLKYTTNKPVKSNSEPKHSPKKPIPKKDSPKKSASPPTASKQRGFLSTGLGRFKNVLQEASDEMRGQQKQSPRSTQKKTTESKSTSPTRTDKNNKSLDDEATKSTKSCSFDMDGGTNYFNLSTSMISCGDGELPNDLALQISIDEGSSFCNSGYAKPLGDAPSPPTPLFMITPDSSALSSAEGQTTKPCSKPLCDPNVLRTLSIPNANTQRETSETTSLKPRVRSIRVRSRS